VPNPTWDVEGWSVVQVIVAELLVMAVAVTEEITGAPAIEMVVKVKLADVAVVPEEFVDHTA
jgi:hypothetical protein